MELSFWETVRSSPTFIILFGCSLVTATFVLERLLYFRRTRIDANVFYITLGKYLKAGDLNVCIQYCQNSPAPLAVVAGVGLANAALSDKRMVELMDAASLE